MLQAQSVVGDRVVLTRKANPPKPELITGLAVTGEVLSSKKQVEDYGALIHSTFRFWAANEELIGSLDRMSPGLHIKLLSSIYAPTRLWAAYSREDVVQFGRPLPKTVDLVSLYKGDRVNVTGSMNYNDQEDSYDAHDILFTYIDQGQKITDSLEGYMKYEHSRGGMDTYTMKWKFRPAQEGQSLYSSYPASQDNIFIGVLYGVVTVEKVEVGDNGDYKTKVTYSLAGQNITNKQVVNFVKWWIECMTPFNEFPER
jgi:hypothetical protein